MKDTKEVYAECPNCKSIYKEEDFNPSFRYISLIECPECIKKVKPNMSAQISTYL